MPLLIYELIYRPSCPDPKLRGRHQPKSESFQPMMLNQPLEPATMLGKTSSPYVAYMQLGVGNFRRYMHRLHNVLQFFSSSKIAKNLLS